MFNKRFYIIVAVLLALILAAGYYSITNGVYPITFNQFFESIFRLQQQEDIDLVIFELRLPRLVLALLIGFGLGVGGAVLQGITKNGLADPAILGINSGAGAFIVAYMLLFQGTFSGDQLLMKLLMPLIGMVGGLFAASIIFLLAWNRITGLDSQRLLLTGIAISTGFGSLSMFLSLKMKAQDFEMATVWLNGTIYNATWTYVVSILPWFLLVVPFIIIKAFKLDLFRLQENVMKGLGIQVEKEKWLLMAGAVVLVSSCVSVSGSIGFIGLICPHIARLLVGLKHRHSLLVCGLVGMLLLTVADFIGRSVVAPAEISVGIILSIIGAPYFIFLLFKAKV